MEEPEEPSSSGGSLPSPTNSVHEDVDMIAVPANSSRVDENEWNRSRRSKSSCLVLNEHTTKETIDNWRRDEEERNDRIPIGFRRSGEEVNSSWAMAARLSIDKDPKSPNYMTEKRIKILETLRTQVKTMGQQAEERVRQYAKGPTDPDHLNMIRRIFDEKKEKYDRYVETEGLKRWSKVFDSESPSKAVMKAPLTFDIQGGEKAEFIEYSEDPDALIISSPIVHLEACAVMPRKNYFLTIGSNFRTPDTNTLSHIPYVGDADHDEEAFTKELVALYNEGVHGTRRSYKNGINDRILFEMLASIGWMARGEPILRDRYFAALHHLFPDKCAIRGIHKKVISLRKRFEEMSRLPYASAARDYYGESWIVIRQLEESDSSDETKEELCYQCGAIRCQLHNKIRPSIIKKYRRPPSPPMEYLTEPRPCSFLCHFLFEARMLHQEKNIRERRWKFGEWRPFWYKIIVKREKKRAMKRCRRTMDSDGNKRIRMDGSDEDDDDDECIVSDLDENEFDDEEMSRRSEDEDDEEESENDEQMPSTSSDSSRRSRSATLSEDYSRNGEDGEGSEQRDPNGDENSSGLSEEMVEEGRGDGSDEDNEYSDRGSREELVKEENEKINEEDGEASVRSEREERSEKNEEDELSNEGGEELRSRGEEEENEENEAEENELKEIRKVIDVLIGKVDEEEKEEEEKEEREIRKVIDILIRKVDEETTTDGFSREEDEVIGEIEEIDEIEVESRENEEEQENDRKYEVEDDEDDAGPSSENDKIEENVSDSEEIVEEESNEDVQYVGEREECSEELPIIKKEETREEEEDEDETEKNSSEEESDEEETFRRMPVVKYKCVKNSRGEIVLNNLDESSSGEGSSEEETDEDNESQKISSDEGEDGESRGMCARELSFMNTAGPSRRRENSESSRDEDEEQWSDSSEWNDEIIYDDEDCMFVKTRRSFPISKRDVPPKRWKDWENPNSFPQPFFTEKEENKVKKALEAGQSVCEIIQELQMMWRATGEMHRYRECYQASAYLESIGLVTVKREYENAEVLSNYERMNLQRSWRKFNSNTVMKNDHTLRPCFHEGKCDEATPPCRCFQLDIPCTKFCSCDVRCRIKFPGCVCAPGKCRSRQCPCYFASWECDPDTCKSCGCDEDERKNQCQNISITLGKRKRIFACRSEIAGYGGFIGEDCKKGELVDEYVGEIISVEESERRGHMYDKLRLSYTFTLNEDEVVDATRAGNVSRFINHSKFPNCVARVFVVKGDHRIGIFARRDLRSGEELFFNYGYRKEHVEAFTNKERDGCDFALYDGRGEIHRENFFEEELEEEVEEIVDETSEDDDDKPSKFEKKIDPNKSIFKMLSPKKSSDEFFE